MPTATLERRRKDLILGSTEPRIFTPPLPENLIDGELFSGTEENDYDDRTTDGYYAIAFAEEILGMPLFPWQKWLLIHGLELIEDDFGNKVYRFRIVIVELGRQNGKTVIATILALWHLFAKESGTVIGTAQDLSKAGDTWNDCVVMAETAEELEELFNSDDIYRGHPKSFTTYAGCQYRVASATRRGGRGFSGDLIILDELREHSNWESWSAVTNTMNARPFAQAWAFSNAGDATSVVLRRQRAQAHRDLGWPDGEDEFDGVLDEIDAELEALLAEMPDIKPGWFEWSAPPGAKRNDLHALAQSNPSLNHSEVTINCPTTRTLLAALAGSPAYEYETEVMCRWATMGVGGPFPEGSWEDTLRARNKARPAPEAKRVVCVEVSDRRSHTYVARATVTEDGKIVVGIRYDHPGTDWVKDTLLKDKAITDLVVVRTEAGSPSLALFKDLERELIGIPLKEWKSADIEPGYSKLFDRLRDRKIYHLAHRGLDMAATSAVPLKKPGGAFRVDIKRSPCDVGSLYAVAGAVWGLEDLIANDYDIMESML